MADTPRPDPEEAQPTQRIASDLLGRSRPPTEMEPFKDAAPTLPPGAAPTQPRPLTGGPGAPALAAQQAGLAREGTLWGGRYRVVRELGHGGMGVVYQAHDTVLGRDVALKVLLVSGRVDDEAIDRFQREAKAAAALEHPNIVRVHDVGRLPASDGGLPYYTMEVLHGQDLAHAIADGSLTGRDAAEAIRQVALALAYAHHKGILHRDLKPQNVFLRTPDETATPAAPTVLKGSASSDVHALLLDFGLAKLTEHDLSSDDLGSKREKSVKTLTQTGQILGTPMYMSPEQARGLKEVDARSDVYSLGATLYHALTGRMPFEAPTLAQLLVAVMKTDPTPPRRIDPDIDLELEVICLACLAKEPRDRYQTAAELAEDCKRFLAGEPISRRPVGAVGRLWRRAKRNKAVAIPVAALSLVILLGLAVWAGVTVQNGVRFRAYCSQAEKALAGGDLKGALAQGQLALAMRPDDHGVKLLLARTRCAEGAIERREYDRRKVEVARLEAVEEAELPEDAGADARDRDREERWGREGALAEARRGRGEAWSNALRRYLEALGHLPDHLDARRALADLYWDEMLRAEGERDAAEALRYAGLVEQFGGDEYAAKVRGEKEVRVRFALPEGFAGREVQAYLFEYVANARPPVLAPVPYDPVNQKPLGEPQVGRWRPLPLKEAAGTAPKAVQEVRDASAYPLRCLEGNRIVLRAVQGAAMFQARLPKGSYLLYIPGGRPQGGPGLYETRYPFDVGREFEWDERCELVADEAPPLPPGLDPSLGSRYWAYVPAGPYRASGDPKAQQSPPRRAARPRVPAKGDEGLFLARFEVTCAMYLAYLDDRAWQDKDAASARLPRQAAEAGFYWEKAGPGGFRIAACGEDWPVFSISWDDAVDYCKWLTKTKGNGSWNFCLPEEDEWEKAARGPDGRPFPWGDSFDATFCRMQTSRPGEQENLDSEPDGLFPLDEGSFGLRDMAGGMGEWTATITGSKKQWRIFKGGSWGAAGALCRLAVRGGIGPGSVGLIVGLRVCARRAPP